MITKDKNLMLVEKEELDSLLKVIRGLKLQVQQLETAINHIKFKNKK